jgi:type IV pilus assembly protein PilB
LSLKSGSGGADERSVEAAHHRLWPALGALLVRSGAIAPETLDRTLAEQPGSGLRLGELLIERGLVTRTAVARALAEQHSLEFVDLGATPIDGDAVGLLPSTLARRYGAVPVRFLDDGALLVAVSDPTNVVHADDLRLALGVPIRVGVAAVDAVAAAITRADAQEIELDDDVDDELEALPEGDGSNVVDLQEAASSAPAIRQINKLIRHSLDLGASDVHFAPEKTGVRVRARVDGVLRDLATLPKAMQSAIMSRLKIMGQLDIAERRLPQDGRASIRMGGRSMDLRVAVLPTTHGEKVTLRIASASEASMSLGQLGMTPETEALFVKAISEPFGTIISCGPTGSGKTSTLYAGLELLNDAERSITTIEDPVEVQVPGVDQVEINPKAGLTFASGLRTILRSDPDVILIGEIRDEETAHVAFRAAMTGHLVLSTLHAHSAASSIARLTDMGIDPALLATSVNAVVAQRLARRLCTECRESYKPDSSEAAEVGVRRNQTLYRPVGCAACGDTGYRGRVGLYELMLIQGDVRRVLDRSTEVIAEAAIAQGMTTLRADGLRLCREGITSLAEVRRVTSERLD